jgi:hypothetical protein
VNGIIESFPARPGELLTEVFADFDHASTVRGSRPGLCAARFGEKLWQW